MQSTKELLTDYETETLGKECTKLKKRASDTWQLCAEALFKYGIPCIKVCTTELSMEFLVSMYQRTS